MGSKKAELEEQQSCHEFTGPRSLLGVDRSQECFGSLRLNLSAQCGPAQLAVCSRSRPGNSASPAGVQFIRAACHGARSAVEESRLHRLAHVSTAFCRDGIFFVAHDRQGFPQIFRHVNHIFTFGGGGRFSASVCLPSSASRFRSFPTKVSPTLFRLVDAKNRLIRLKQANQA